MNGIVIEIIKLLQEKAVFVGGVGCIDCVNCIVYIVRG